MENPRIGTRGDMTKYIEEDGWGKEGYD